MARLAWALASPFGKQPLALDGAPGARPQVASSSTIEADHSSASDAPVGHVSAANLCTARGTGSGTHRRGGAGPGLALVILVAAAWAALFGWLAVRRFLAGGAHAEDLGFTDQVLANFLRGQWFRMSIYEGATWNTELDVSRLARPDSLLAFHFEPLLLALVPLYALGGGMRTLLILQAGAVAAGAVAVFRLTLHACHSQVAAMAVALAYLGSPLGQWAVLDDFHTSTLGAPLLLLAIERLVVARAPWQALAVALLAAMTREDVGLIVAILGVTLSIWPTYRKFGVAFIGLGLACSAVAALVICAYAGGASPLSARYEATLGSGFDAALQALVRPPVLAYASTIALSGGWLGLLDPALLLPALPTLAINVFSTSSWMMAGKAHYSALVLPFIALAASGALRRLRARRHAVAAASGLLLVTTALSYADQGSGPLGGNAAMAESSTHTEQAQSLAASLPADASVSASSPLVPLVSRRSRVYVFPAIRDADYVLLDLTSSPAPTSAGDVFLRVRGLLQQGGWQVDHAADGLLLLQRLDAAGPTEIRDLAHQIVPSRPSDTPFEMADTAPTYASGRVRLLSATLIPSPDGAVGVDGPHWILRTTWRAEAPLPSTTRVDFNLQLRDVGERRVWDIADLWWNPPQDWPVGQTVTIDVPEVPVRQFISWQARFSDSS